MEAGFFNLFRWGRYGGGGPPSGSSGSNKHEERERFAAAAVAFCLKHDKKFLQHFLVQCCGIAKNDLGSALPDIRVEDHKWGDLIVCLRRKWACVIEFKIGSGHYDLQAKQNPKEDAFWSSGYGRMIVKAEELGCTKRIYVVLGSQKHHASHTRNGLRHLWVGWHRVNTDQLQKTPLIRDLCDCLGRLGVPDFRFMTTKQTDKLRLRLADATAASTSFAILGDTARELDLTEGQFWPAASCGDRWFGVYVGRVHSTAKGYPKKLRGAVKSDPRAWLAWYGYEYDGQCLTLSVCFYCTPKTRDKLSKKLSRFHPKTDHDNWYLVVKANAASEAGHKEWFLKVLRAAV